MILKRVTESSECRFMNFMNPEVLSIHVGHATRFTGVVAGASLDEAATGAALDEAATPVPHATLLLPPHAT